MCVADSIPVTFITLNHIFTWYTKNYVHRLELQIVTLHLTLDYFYRLVIHAKYEKNISRQILFYVTKQHRSHCHLYATRHNHSPSLTDSAAPTTGKQL
jgi:hypothetical protein